MPKMSEEEQDATLYIRTRRTIEKLITHGEMDWIKGNLQCLVIEPLQ